MANLDQPNDLPRLANDFKVLKAFQKEGQIEGDDGKEVDHVHRSLQELQFPRADNQPDGVLNGEVADGDVVNDTNDVEEEGKLHQALLVFLQLVDGGDDEGDGGDEDHGEGEKSAEPGENMLSPFRLYILRPSNTK